MVMIPTAYALLEPALAKIVINTCSLRLKGPGFSEKDHFVPGILTGVAGSQAAINFPMGRTAIWAETDDMYSGFCL